MGLYVRLLFSEVGEPSKQARQREDEVGKPVVTQLKTLPSYINQKIPFDCLKISYDVGKE
jgi:hypothetical protein